MRKSSRVRPAFTLVELLLVIAVIAILASLLMPALESARENARRIVCLSQLRQTGQSVGLYANDFDGLYPSRDSLRIRVHCEPFILASSYGIDDRVALGPYLPLNLMLNCPLSIGPADFAGTPPDGDPARVVYSDYNMFWGWGLNGTRQMDKPGDRLTYSGHDFNVLAADHYRFWGGAYDVATSSHRDGANVISRKDNSAVDAYVWSVWQSPLATLSHARTHGIRGPGMDKSPRLRLSARHRGLRPVETVSASRAFRQSFSTRGWILRRRIGPWGGVVWSSPAGGFTKPYWRRPLCRVWPRRRLPAGIYNPPHAPPL